MKSVGGFFTWIGDNVKALKQVFAPIAIALEPVVNAFRQVFREMGLVGDGGLTLKNVFGWIGNALIDISPVLNAFGGALASIIAYFRRVIGGVVDLYNRFEGLQYIVKGVAATFITIFTRLGNFVENIFRGMGTSIEGLFNLDFKQIKFGISQITSAFTSGLSGFGADVDKNMAALSKKRDFFTNVISVVDTDRDPDAIHNALDKDKTKKKPNPFAPPGGGGGGELSGIRGGDGGGIKNITINIGKLNEGGITVQTTTLGMGTSQIKAELERMLLSVVNDVNYQ